MPLLLWSFIIGVLAEVALIANWRILAAREAAPDGIVQFTWIWPITWFVLFFFGSCALLLAGRLSRGGASSSNTRTAEVMLLRLVSPILLVIGPVLMLLYSLVMVFAAISATQGPPLAS